MSKKKLCLGLNFYPVGMPPPRNSPSDTYLLYNQCDGFHIAYSRFDEEGFVGFFNFLGTSEYDQNFYEAWATLPDCNDVLFPAFGSTPSRAAIASVAALAPSHLGDKR